MMRSPTILNVLPEGGDSRKQVMMVFVLAVLGCGVFTIYAGSLFLRIKSRETGIFLALGAQRSQVKRELERELLILSLGSCLAGLLLGGPLAWLLWQLFRLCAVDTEQMLLRFDPKSYALSGLFSLFVVLALFWMGRRSVKNTNIMDIVQQSRKSEPIHAVPQWYGMAGIALLVVGGFLGYIVPSLCVIYLHWYAPGCLTSVFYLPALVGLYWILLHTVVNGWHHSRHRYKDPIATSMMKFQGRQTVNNMLVMSVLIAGAYFGSFYTPMLGTGTMMTYDNLPVDYSFHYRSDQPVPDEQQIRSLAQDMGVEITSYAQAPMARLGVDGEMHMEVEGPLGTTWYEQHYDVMTSCLFLPESAYRALTGEALELEPGQVSGVLDATGDGRGRFGAEIHLVTNYITGQQLKVTPVEPRKNDLLFGRFILDDGDYQTITQGLPDSWLETTVFFNAKNCEDTYDFAKALFNRIVDASGTEVAVLDAWDPIERDRDIQEEGHYYFDDYCFTYDQRNGSDFRLYWQYMPQFRVLGKADFVKTTAVFLILFIFIAVVCFAAVFIIAYTRCMTIALTNRQVYEDMRKLGAPNAYLFRSLRGQVSRVFLVPALVGTSLIYAFYTTIMFFNDNRLTAQELTGMAMCLLVVAGISALFYLFYRLTLHKVCQSLNVRMGRTKEKKNKE